MAEIISGSTWSQEIQCPYCGSTLKLVSKTIGYYEGSLGDYHDFSEYIWNCTVCESENKIDYKVIPSGIKATAQKQKRKIENPEVIARKPWTYEYQCSGCPARIKIDESDITHSESSSIESDWHKYETKCPACNTENQVPDGEIPPGIQKKARKRK